MIRIPSFLLLLAIVIAVPLQILLSPEQSSDTRYHFYKLQKSLATLIEWFRGRNGTVDSETVQISAETRNPRDPRPPSIKYRVGDVVRHKIHGYRGVIIGWDEKAIAPTSWIAVSHKGRMDWSELPNYSIIIDTKDRFVPQFAYVVEENIELNAGRVNHPLIKNYFEYYDGRHYIPRPWYKKIYPND